MRFFFAALMFIGLTFGQGLHSIRRIHVGSMGQSDEAERFRFVLEEQLRKSGFETTEKPETADAILTGVLVVRVFAEGAQARATVTLKSPEGTKLWAGDFSPRRSFNPLRDRDTVKLRAENIAEELRKACGNTGKRR